MKRGAFTGASAQRIGRFELADKSSLVRRSGRYATGVTAEVAACITGQEFERLGSNKIIQTDVRLIAATNRDLKKMVADREFRSDLYYRRTYSRFTCRHYASVRKIFRCWRKPLPSKLPVVSGAISTAFLPDVAHLEQYGVAG